MRSNLSCPMCRLSVNVDTRNAQGLLRQHMEDSHPRLERVTIQDWSACAALVGWALIVLAVAWLA